MSDRRRVALLVGQPDEEYQSKFISGFLENAFANNTDVCIFAMFRKYQDTEVRDIAEANIFNLPNWEKFDGVVILKDSIQSNGIALKIEETLKEKFKGVVLVIDLKSDSFESVITDGYQPTYEVISHLIEHHGFQRIAYLTGKKWHAHSIQRLSAFRDAMKNHGLSVNEEWIVYGDFWYTSGELCAETLINSKEGLPEAVACSNDCMAIGLCKAFESRGIHIPDDIAVVGFDSIEEGRRSPKPVTSTILPAYKNGKYAAEYMNAKFKGKQIPDYDIKADLFIGQSCGCKTPLKEEDFYNSYLRKEWGTEVSQEGYNSTFNSITANLSQESSLEGYLNTVYSYIFQLREAEHFSLCLSKSWKNMDSQNLLNVVNNGYQNQMIRAIRYEKSEEENVVGLDEIFDTSDMLPELYIQTEKPRAFFFTPFYYENRCFGYTVISYGNKARSYDDVYRLWMIQISCGLESVRRNLVIDILERQNKPSGKFSRSGKAGALTKEEEEEYELVREILDKNLFEYHFQPIVRTLDGNIYSYEALMRSKTDKKISPLNIIKYAGMMNRLEDIEKYTFLNILSLVDEKIDVFGDRKVFINSIPGIRIGVKDLESVSDYLSRYSKTVVVELTEEAELDDTELDAMKEYYSHLGIDLAVDDYGTGYSNVNNLLRYMPNVVKIDRSLLSEIQNKPQKQHFVREIIEFCHDNGILALAEGVETREELQNVIMLGADLIQGYYTGRPKAEIVTEINENIRKEIVLYKQEQMDGKKKHLYIAGRTNRVSLNSLVRSGNTDIMLGSKNVVYKDISIIGSPGLKTDINLHIEPEYEGIVTLENAYLSNVKNRPCIEIGENARVTLVLKGENKLFNGGIRVPQSSKLTIEGDGNLLIELNLPKSFGIGNQPDMMHGDIIFAQDGEINIHSKGKEGICIGSELGGNIRIKRGKYTLEGNGDVCVGIGSVNADNQIIVESCYMEIFISATKAVGIGSLNNSTQVFLKRSAVSVDVGGDEVVGIGTLQGKESRITGENCNVIVSGRSMKSTNIGSLNGDTVIDIKHASLTLNGNGKEALVFGGWKKRTVISMANGEIKSEILNKDGIITFAKREESAFENVAFRIRVNGEEKEDIFDESVL